MEEWLYPECCPAIGWPDFREAYMQALQEDEELCDYAESFYRMHKEQWCQADVTFSCDNLSHREQTEPMPQQYSDLESRWEEKTLYL